MPVVTIEQSAVEIGVRMADYCLALRRRCLSRGGRPSERFSFCLLSQINLLLCCLRQLTAAIFGVLLTSFINVTRLSSAVIAIYLTAAAVIHLRWKPMPSFHRLCIALTFSKPARLSGIACSKCKKTGPYVAGGGAGKGSAFEVRPRIPAIKRRAHVCKVYDVFSQRPSQADVKACRAEFMSIIYIMMFPQLPLFGAVQCYLSWR